MVASIEKSSTQGFRKQKNKIVIRHSLKADMNTSIPDEGEIVFATDTKDLLIGDGITKVQDLSPISGGGAGLPEQTGHAGEFLTTNGSEVSWSITPQSDWTQTDVSAPDYIKNKPYIPSGVIVDQTYDPTSTNAQSGIAVAEAVGNVDTALDTHIANKNNPHSVTKAQVGLGNVDNTSDLDKPVSTATQTALNLKANTADVYGKTETYSQSEVDSKLAEKLDTTVASATYTTQTQFSEGLATKQNTLSAEQLAAVNSGITAEHITAYDAYAGEISAVETTANKADSAAEVAQQTANLVGQNLQAVTEKIPTTASSSNLLVDTETMNTALSTKADTLTTEQLKAVNSGITADKVSEYDNYVAMIIKEW